MTLTRLLRIDDVTAITGLSRSSIYARMKDGTFPASVKVGPRGTRWTQAAIGEFIASLEPQYRKGGEGTR